MGRLEPAQRHQAAEMVKAGKTVDEIVSFMKQTYGVDVKPSFVYYLKKQANGSAPGQKRQYKKRGEKAPAQDPADVIQDEATMSISDLARDIEARIRASHEVYRGIFLHLRREIIKATAKLRDLKKEFEAKADAEASAAMSQK